MLKPKQALGAPLPFPWVHGWNPIIPIPQLNKYTLTNSHAHTHTQTNTRLRVNPLSLAAIVTMEMIVRCLWKGLCRCMIAHLDLISNPQDSLLISIQGFQCIGLYKVIHQVFRSRKIAVKGDICHFSTVDAVWAVLCLWVFVATA